MNRTTAAALGLTVFGAVGLLVSFASAPSARPAAAESAVLKPYALAVAVPNADPRLACRNLWRTPVLSVGHACRREAAPHLAQALR